MTEQEWLECTNPAAMLDCLPGKASDRKLRLFSVACCNRVEHLVPAEMGQQEFKVPEVFTYRDGEEMDAWLFRRGLQAEASMSAPEYRATSADVGRSLGAAANVCWAAARIATRASGGRMFGPVFKAEEAAQATLLRDIFGNPFRSVTIAPTWRSNEVVRLAGHVYQERAFDGLPALADALEEAGCHDAAVLGHLQGPGPHVRGCWPVDLILGQG